MEEDNNYSIPIIGLILYFLLCNGCRTFPQEGIRDYHLLYECEQIAYKSITKKDLEQKDEC